MLKAAIELDIFTAIAEGANTTEALSKRTDSSERGIRILCDALATHGFLLKNYSDKAPSTYTLPDDTAMFLNRNSRAFMGNAADFLVNPEIVSGWTKLTTAVRTGRTALPDNGTCDTEDPIWVNFAKGMVNMMFPAAQEIATRILPQTGPVPANVLDIAAGHGIFGVSIAQHYPAAQITACDWPSVLEVAESNARKFGVADRHSKLAGDALKLDFGSEVYDVVLVTNFLHHFTPDTNIEFMKKDRTALKPGGRVLVLEFVPNNDRISPKQSAHFPLVMLAGTVAGDAYTEMELGSMFSSAGFTRTEKFDLQTAPQSVLVTWR
jgi:ubiquinone/menaquinone biosynthesis C-methylase UbiE